MAEYEIAFRLTNANPHWTSEQLIAELLKDGLRQGIELLSVRPDPEHDLAGDDDTEPASGICGRPDCFVCGRGHAARRRAAFDPDGRC
jgi:hypothetical protein